MRWTIRLLSVVLFCLFTWLLSFVIRDINGIRGPNQQVIFDAEIDSELTQGLADYNKALQQIQEDRNRQEEIKRNRSEAMGVAKDTWAEVQKVHQFELAAGRQPSAELSEDLSQAHQRYISAQTTFEEANTKLADLGDEEYATNQALREISDQVAPQRTAAQALYTETFRRHRHSLAIYKFSFIIPVFLIAAWAVAKRRESVYRPILKAMLLASFFQVGRVMHEHFDREYFKYIALSAAALIVLAFLMRLLQSSAKPRPDLLLKQRREAYHRSQCPECAYPFPAEHADAFTCPACGVGLFSACSSCENSRHHLLPFCVHCGREEPAPAKA